MSSVDHFRYRVTVNTQYCNYNDPNFKKIHEKQNFLKTNACAKLINKLVELGAVIELGKWFSLPYNEINFVLTPQTSKWEDLLKDLFEDKQVVFGAVKYNSYGQKVNEDEYYKIYISINSQGRI